MFEKIFEPIKPGDVPATYASTDLLHEAIGFKPETSIDEGLRKFTEWYVGFYGVVSRSRRISRGVIVYIILLFCCFLSRFPV